VEKQAQSVQYTIRGVPQEIDQALRRKAARLRQSLNQVILDELRAAATGAQKRADFSDVVGHWTPDPAFDKIIAAQRKIDPEEWK
jgi:hypothetical protein